MGLISSRLEGIQRIQYGQQCRELGFNSHSRTQWGQWNSRIRNMRSDLSSNKGDLVNRILQSVQIQIQIQSVAEDAKATVG